MVNPKFIYDLRKHGIMSSYMTEDEKRLALAELTLEYIEYSKKIEERRENQNDNRPTNESSDKN